MDDDDTAGCEAPWQQVSRRGVRDRDDPVSGDHRCRAEDEADDAPADDDLVDVPQQSRAPRPAEDPRHERGGRVDVDAPGASPSPAGGRCVEPARGRARSGEGCAPSGTGDGRSPTRRARRARRAPRGGRSASPAAHHRAGGRGRRDAHRAPRRSAPGGSDRPHTPRELVEEHRRGSTARCDGGRHPISRRVPCQALGRRHARRSGRGYGGRPARVRRSRTAASQRMGRR